MRHGQTISIPPTNGAVVWDQGILTWQELHGLLMFSSWTVLSFLVLISARFMKSHWRCWNYFHAILGFIIWGASIGTVAFILSQVRIVLTTDVHTWIGFSMCGISTI